MYLGKWHTFSSFIFLEILISVKIQKTPYNFRVSDAMILKYVFVISTEGRIENNNFILPWNNKYVWYTENFLCHKLINLLQNTQSSELILVSYWFLFRITVLKFLITMYNNERFSFNCNCNTIEYLTYSNTSK